MLFENFVKIFLIFLKYFFYRSLWEFFYIFSATTKGDRQKCFFLPVFSLCYDILSLLLFFRKIIGVSVRVRPRVPHNTDYVVLFLFNIAKGKAPPAASDAPLRSPRYRCAWCWRLNAPKYPPNARYPFACCKMFWQTNAADYADTPSRRAPLPDGTAFSCQPIYWNDPAPCHACWQK